MYLFDDFIDANKNFLPEDGTVNYYGKLLTQEKATVYYESLLKTIQWKNDIAIIVVIHRANQ